MSNRRSAIAAAAFIGSAWLYIHDRQLETRRVIMRHPRLPAGFDGVKILHLSDLHHKTFGEMNGNLISSCEACKPDLIFFTGDVISRNESRDFFDAKLFLFEKLCAVAPVYFIKGNHEQDNIVNGEYICRHLKKIGVTVLENESVFIERNGDKVVLTGLVPDIECYHKGHRFNDLKPITRSYLNEILPPCRRDMFNILLAHNPLGFEGYEGWGADLIFSGHVHGGIIRLPLLGGILSPERRFFPKYSKGTYFSGEAKMQVTSGLGKLRINNRSEIVLCTLRRK